MKKRSKVKGLLRVLVILETILLIFLLILIGKVLTESHAEKQAAKNEESVIKGEVVAETEEKQKSRRKSDERKGRTGEKGIGSADSKRADRRSGE